MDLTALTRWLGIAFVLVFSTMPSHAADHRKPRVLVVTTTTGFRHDCIPTSERILAQLAAESGAFEVDFARDPTELTKLAPSSLKDFDGVIFASTTGDLPIPDRDAFLAWIKEGHAFVGIHAATDTFPNWPAYLEMIGGQFEKHGPQVGVECLNGDTSHPATGHLGKSWTIPLEEIYQFKNYDPNRVHELLSLDRHPNAKTPGHFPLAWCRDYGQGKVFYTSLGHREDLWDADPSIADRQNPPEVSKAFQAHILGGIKWALGLAAGNSNPHPR